MPERLFFAIWPDEAARIRLDFVAQMLHRECGGKMTRRESIHLTLVFLGEINVARMADLRRIASLVSEDAFEIRVDLAGYWKHNRIAWVGTSECPPGLARFVAALQRGLACDGFEFDARTYFPHITLVRKATPWTLQPEFEAFSWRATEFCLVKSTNSGYTILDKWPLSAPQR